MTGQSLKQYGKRLLAMLLVLLMLCNDIPISAITTSDQTEAVTTEVGEEKTTEAKEKATTEAEKAKEKATTEAIIEKTEKKEAVTEAPKKESNTEQKESVIKATEASTEKKEEKTTQSSILSEKTTENSAKEEAEKKTEDTAKTEETQKTEEIQEGIQQTSGIQIVMEYDESGKFKAKDFTYEITYKEKKEEYYYEGVYELYDLQGNKIEEGQIKQNAKGQCSVTPKESGDTLVLCDVKEGVTYQVTQLLSGGQALENERTQEIKLTSLMDEQDKVLTFTSREAAEPLTFTVTWNDAQAMAKSTKEEKETYAKEHIYIQYQLKDSQTWHVLDPEEKVKAGEKTQMEKLGIASIPQIEAKYDKNEWTYTYTDLLPAKTNTGQEVTYGIYEKPVDGYVDTYKKDSNTDIVNTIESDYKANICWDDEQNAKHVRPSIEDYVQDIELHRFTGKNENATKLAGDKLKDYITITEDKNTWNLSTTGLPAYDEEGNAYTYYITSSKISGEDKTTGATWTYEPAYEAQNDETQAAKLLYSGKTLTYKLNWQEKQSVAASIKNKIKSLLGRAATPPSTLAEQPQAVAEGDTITITTTYAGEKSGKLTFKYKVTVGEDKQLYTDDEKNYEIQDAKGKPIDGATISLENGVLTAIVPVGKDNVTTFNIVLNNVTAGTYTIENTSAPDNTMCMTEKSQTTNPATFDFRDKAETQTLTKTWNDGRVDHDTDKDWFVDHLSIVASIEGENKEITDTTDWEEKIGLTKPKIDEGNITITGSVWTYDFTNLPKTDKNGKKITYTFKETKCKDENCSICKNYISTYTKSDGTADDSKQSIMNTLKVNTDDSNSDYSATIVWKDKDQITDDKHPSRPTETDYVNVDNIKLYRYTSNSPTPVEVTLTKDDIANYIKAAEKTGENNSHTNQWNITIKDLPKFDDQGNEYIYYIEQTADFATNQNEDKYKYDKEYVNTGAYGTESNGLYNGGTLTNTRKETMEFLFDVEWIDGNSTWLEDCNLYLYRYAEGDDGSVETASPVQGFDTMCFENGTLYYVKSDGTKVEVQKKDGQYVWTGTDGTTRLDKFAPSGARYTYFIKQKNLGSADYKDSYYDSGSTTERTDKYILNNGKIVNQLENTVTPSITKKWEAKAVQGITDKLSVVLGLEKRYVYQTSENEEKKYTEWEAITQVPEGKTEAQPVSATVGGFSSAVLEKEVGFSEYPEYTDKKIENAVLENSGGTVELKAGTKIEYRCKETGITYEKDENNTETFTFKDNRLVMEKLGAEGTDIVVEQEYSDDGKTITNKLVDRTQVKVTKTWSGLEEGQWPKGAVVNVRLKREDGVTPVKDLAGNNVSSITLSEGNKEDIFKNLPRYDDNGREITYYIEEKETTVIADGKEYSYYDTSYSRTTVASEGVNIRETDATIHNTLPGPGDITINVNKRWLDDGDMSHRENVLVGIFSRSDITNGTAFRDNKLDPDKAVAQAEIKDGDAWTKKLSFEPNRKTYYWTFEEGYTIDNATQTTDNSNPVYYKEGNHLEQDGSPLYWKDGAVSQTTTVTDYPVYIQKTTVEYTTSAGTEQATNYDGSSLYWEDTAKTKTTTDKTDHEPVMIQKKSDEKTKAVYLDANGKETTEKTDRPVYIPKTENEDSFKNYIALEIKVGNDSVTYNKKNDSYAWLLEEETQIPSYKTFEDKIEATYQIGDVEAANHLYNVYLGYTEANGMAGYVIYNQRKGVQKITLTKTWNNGEIPKDEQPKAAYYKLYQWLDDKKTDVTESLGGGTQTLAAYGTIDQADADRIGKVVEVKNDLSEDNLTENEIKAVFQDLPKYDHLGRLLHYTAEEVAVKDPAPTTTTTTYPIRLVDHGVVKVSVKQDGEFKYNLDSNGSNVAYYDTYATSMTETQTKSGNKNTDDEFEFKSTNTRSQKFEVTLRKVWQDDGTNQEEVNVRRPDIYFRMYRIAIKNYDDFQNAPKTEKDLLDVEDVETLTSKSKQVGGDYIWNTKKNNWYWTCETDGTFDRYDSAGNEYLYYAIEKSQDFNGYSVKYYNGETLPNIKNQDDTAVSDTTQVFNPDQSDYKGNLLVVHKEGDGLQSNGTIVNVKEDKFDATAEKKWLNLPDNMKKENLPDIYMELRRRLVLDERSQNYGPWETVSVKKNEGGAATSVFKDVEKYDEYGRRYEFTVQEKYYQSYDVVDVATKLSLGADSKFIIIDQQTGTGSILNPQTEENTSNSQSGSGDSTNDQTQSQTDLDSILNDKTSSVTIGEGYYIQDGSSYVVPTESSSVDGNTKFYTLKVTYTQDNEGAYVKTAENEFVTYNDLLDSEKEHVKASNRYNQTIGDTTADDSYQELGSNTILALNYVPGYKPGVQQGDNKFTWTNEYDPNAQVRQRVEIKVSKKWSVPDYAKELPVQEFELWRRIDGIENSDEKVFTDSQKKKDISGETVTNNSKTVNTEITFKTINDNSNNNKYLAYFAPNGKPYIYYVKEIVPSGYLGSVAGAAGSNPNTQQGDGSAVLQTQDIKLNYYTASDGTIVFYNYDTTKTGDEAKDTTTSYTNTYNGLPVVTNKTIKKWVDQNNVFGMRPNDIDLTLKQSGGGITERTVAEYNTNKTPNVVNGSWSNDTNKTNSDSDTWEFTFKNDQIKDEEYLKEIDSIKDNANNFPKYGPNGEEYTYKVSESKSASDNTNKFGSYDQKIVTTKDGNAITNTITNTLPTTSISAKKVWKGTDGTTVNRSDYLEGDEGTAQFEEEVAKHTWTYDGTNTAHSDEELQKLYNLGAIPSKITYKLQYTDSDKTDANLTESDWTDVPDDTDDAKKKYTKVYDFIQRNSDGTPQITSGELSWKSFNDVTEMRDEGVTFENLSKYVLGTNSTTVNGKLRRYRILETSEFTTVTADTSKEPVVYSTSTRTTSNVGQFAQEGTATSAVGDGTNNTSIVTNTVRLKKVTLKKYWDDGGNYINTRPGDITFVVDDGNGSDTYRLTNSMKENGNSTSTWATTVWVPNTTINVTEPMDKQSTTTQTALNNCYNHEKNKSDEYIYPTVTESSDGNTITVTNKMDAIAKRTSITASKTWDYNSKDYAYLNDAIRPKSITYTLQYCHKKAGEETYTDWSDADSGCGIDVGDNSEVKNEKTSTYDTTKKEWLSQTWTNLFQYYNDPNTDEALPIKYRVLENKNSSGNSGGVSGYTVSVSDPIVAKDATNVADKTKPYDTEGTITVTNKIIDSGSVTLKKEWLNANVVSNALAGSTATGNTITTAENIKKLQTLGLLPTAIKFRLQYRTVDTSNSNTVKKDWTSVDRYEEFAETNPTNKISDLISGKTFSNLPTTDIDGDKMEYRFVEVEVKFGSETTYRDVESGAKNILYTVGNPSVNTDGKTTTIQNTIPSGTITVTKKATDEENRDGVRGDIYVSLYRTGGTSAYATGVLTYDSTTKTWGSCQWTVPVYDSNNYTDNDGVKNKWTITETGVGASNNLNDYTATYTYKDSSSNLITGDVTVSNGTGISSDIENARTPARFNATASKTWVGDNDNIMETRPTNDIVNLTLQYKLSDTWQDVNHATAVYDYQIGGKETFEEGKKQGSYEYVFTESNGKYYKWNETKYEEVTGKITDYIYRVNKDRYYSWNDATDKMCYEENGTLAFTTSAVTQEANGKTGTDAKTATWNNLCVNSNGSAITYRVVENEDDTHLGGAGVKGYTTSFSTENVTNVTGQTDGSFTAASGAAAKVTVTNTMQKTRIVVQKYWSGDMTNAYTKAMRPTSVTFYVEYSHDGGSSWQELPDIPNSKIVKGLYTLTISNTDSNNQGADIGCEGGNWQKPMLPQYDSAGNQYLYRVSEVYMTYSDGSVVTTYHNGKDSAEWKAMTDNTGSKVNTNSNLGENETLGAYKVSGNTTWYPNGSNNDTSARWFADITNTLETVTVKTSKVWDDNDNRDQIEKKVTFGLNVVPNDFSVTEKVSIETTANPATATWTSVLPKYQKNAVKHDNTNLYAYEVTEESVDDYTASYKQPDITSTASPLSATVTNTHNIYNFEIKGKKKWDDDLDAVTNGVRMDKDSKDAADTKYTRPESVDLTLQYEATETTSSGGTKTVWKDISKALLVNETTFPTTLQTDGTADATVIYFEKKAVTPSADGYYKWSGSAYTKVDSIPTPTEVKTETIPTSKYSDAEYIKFTRTITSTEGYYQWDSESSKYVKLDKLPDNETASEVEAETVPSTKYNEADYINFTRTVTHADGYYKWNGSAYEKIPGAPKALNVTDETVPSTKYNEADYINFTRTVTQADGYYKWDGSKYVPDASGVYTTSDVTQTIRNTDWTKTTDWKNLPVNRMVETTTESGTTKTKEVVNYRVVESGTTGGTPEYLFAKPSDTITGLDRDEKVVTTVTGEVANKLNMLKLVKKDGKGNKLSGINFKIQMIKNAEGTEVTNAPEFTGTTNTDGEVSFVGLKKGTYQITELNTAQGLQLLSAPFEVKIPLTMSQTDIDAWNEDKQDNEKINLDNAVQLDDQSGWNFYQLTYTVTNSANFDMPVTGNKGMWYPGLFGFLPIMAAWIFYRRKKRQMQS